MTGFSLSEQPEVFFTTTATSRALRAHLRKGEVRRLGARLYTRNLTDDPAEIARRNWWRVAAGYFPGAVISERTALEFKPASTDGSVTLVSGTRREVKLPGLRLRSRAGPGPSNGDEQWMGEAIFMSSRPRAFLENLRLSRARGGAARTLSRGELEDRLLTYVAGRREALNVLRDQARELAPALGAEAEFARLDDLIGSLHGTRDGRLERARARAHRAGLPYDEHRLARFDELQHHLLVGPPPPIGANRDHDRTTLAFFEAYLSNFIEGTEFTVEEAERIVFEGVVPEQRPRDAHDILGVYRVVADRSESRRVPGGPGELVDILRSQHAMIMHERPEVGPGEFKREPNRAGSTDFVAPELVEGTLREGYRRYDTLPVGFARAVFAMFLVSEVHPFADGNGRIARVLMNSELSAAGEQRIVVPIAARDDYLHALRGMTHNGNAPSLVRVLKSLRRLSSEIDFTSRPAAGLDFHRRDLLRDPGGAERLGAALFAWDAPTEG